MAFKSKEREKEYMHKYYLEHKDKIRAQNDAWKKEHADEYKESQKRWREEHKKDAAEYARKYREEHRNEINERTNKWRKDNLEERRDYQREFMKKNYQKYRAKNNTREMTRNAVNRGVLTKKPCEVCGEKIVEAHHPDYSEPLKVVWLCKRCHARLHRNDNKRVKAYMELNGQLPDGVESSGDMLRINWK